MRIPVLLLYGTFILHKIVSFYPNFNVTQFSQNNGLIPNNTIVSGVGNAMPTLHVIIIGK